MRHWWWRKTTWNGRLFCFEVYSIKEQLPCAIWLISTITRVIPNISKQSIVLTIGEHYVDAVSGRSTPPDYEYLPPNMKIDRSRLRKSSSEVPPECQALIDRLCACSREELLDELSKINTWTFGKCELYHWTTVLDIFDDILQEAATPEDDNKWALCCDIHYNHRVSCFCCVLVGILQNN